MKTVKQKEKIAQDKENELWSKGDALWDADPNCKHVVKMKLSGGIACEKCGGWFCY